MVKSVTVNDLRSRIVLCKSVDSFDDENNLIRNITEYKPIWAKVEEKRAAVDETQVGQKPIVNYVITIRKMDLSDIKTVKYKGKILEMRTPFFTDNPAFIQFEAGEIDGEILV